MSKEKVDQKEKELEERYNEEKKALDEIVSGVVCDSSAFQKEIRETTIKQFKEIKRVCSEYFQKYDS